MWFDFFIVWCKKFIAPKIKMQIAIIKKTIELTINQSPTQSNLDLMNSNFS